MDVQFTDSFWKSLKTMNRHQTWWYKTYELFRYNIPLFFKNIWRFRKELYNHQWWDYRFTLEMLYRSLSIMVAKLETDGIEEDGSRGKKVQKIKRALELLKHKLDDDYVNRAEVELGELPRKPFEFEKMEDGNYLLVDNDTPAEREHAQKIYKRAREIEDTEWKELWEIFKGTKFSKKFGWAYDGSDMRGWWD